MAPIAESLNPLGKPIDRIVPPPFIEVARSQLAIRLLAREHVKDTDHHRVSDRYERTLHATPCRQPSI